MHPTKHDLPEAYAAPVGDPWRLVARIGLPAGSRRPPRIAVGTLRARKGERTMMMGPIPAVPPIFALEACVGKSARLAMMEPS
jgi:hypothetical protein